MPQARQAISKAILLCSKADHYTPLSNVLVDKLGYKRTCFLQKLHAWSQSASGAEVDGAKWVYNTYDEWAKQTRIPNSTLRVLIKKLEETGIVISANLNKNKQNKTKWYTINYEKLKGIMQENQSAEAHLIETVAESMPIISNIVKDNSQAVLKEVQQIDQKGKCSKEKTDEFVKPLLSMLGIPWSPLKDSFYSHFNDKLIEHFGNGDEGFDKFKAYCMAISQNELLMGKKPMRDGRYFKINLKTILSQKFINNYSEGEGFFSPLQATGEDMGRKTAILAKEFPTITLKDVKDTAETSFDQSVKADLFQSLGEKNL